ncbi:MAG: sulfurtransferase-like selenium metabolism protein YedF [Firmicutes bacterium HGW-Firmicutes-11]|jgi:selenium metabolism protein YedF|nr:MAG: sulfurtransferase-like selenium metabolism protein YedF [Firmicutes bacterium HGW-Firmicutes-11]
MSSEIDARGKSCPIPVVMAKKETDQGTDQFSILVDNKTAVENLKRFAKSRGYEVNVTESGADFLVAMNQSGSSEECQLMDFEKSWAVLIGRDGIGEGDPELGATLLKMFLYTLCESDDLPSYILMMNGGVRVAVDHEQSVEHLQSLEERGVSVLVCGTCLNYFGLQDAAKVGTVSNMYDIETAMVSVDKVVTL